MDDDPLLAVAPQWRTADRAALAAEFTTAEPFPLLVLDDFLAADVADGLVAEFPALDEMPRSRDYLFGDKHELSSVADRGTAARRYAALTGSEGFRTLLAHVTGHPDLFVDAESFGGGFHQGGDGSFLDLHVDFNLHPQHRTWLRTLNVLLYLNPGWRDEWGGELLVKADPADEPRRIAPRHNRLVVMTTDDRTFHGYERMSLPAGVHRRSIATYFYRDLGEAGARAVRRRTTGWVPEHAGPVKRFAARHYNAAVLAKNRVLGSRTARNR